MHQSAKCTLTQLLKQKPIVVGICLLVTCAAWCVVSGLYYHHVNSTGARYWGVDVVVTTFASVARLDKFAMPILQLAFANWWSNRPDNALVGIGLFCGAALAAVGGVYFFAWSIGRAFRTFIHAGPIDKTLRMLTQLLVFVSLAMAALGLWYTAKMTSSWAASEAIGTVLLHGFVGISVGFAIYGLLAWAGYWCVIAGHQLSQSTRLTK